MGRPDWYRQTEWSEAHASAFFERLARSRSAFHKAQYLHLQAGALAGTGNHAYLGVALDLLERIFKDYPDEFSVLPAYLTAAQCHDALGNIKAATYHFERALAEQTRRPNFIVGVTLEFPWFIARRGLVELYDKAIEMLTMTDAVFPYQRFQASACRAFIAAHRGKPDVARASAQAALEAAGAQRSPFARHPTIGLVGNQYREWVERLRALAAE